MTIMTSSRRGVEGHVPRLPIEEARAVAEQVGMDPDLTNIHLFQVLLNAPAAGAAINGMKDVVLKGLTIDPRLRELAIMRTAWLLGAEYVWNHHTRPHVEHDLNLFPDDILDVRNWEASNLGAVERAVLRVTDEMVTAPTGEASDEAMEAVLAELPVAAVVELVVTVALYRGLSSITRTLRVPMEAEYIDWEPDGVAP